MNPAEPVEWQGRTCTRADLRRELRRMEMAPELVRSVVTHLSRTAQQLPSPRLRRRRA